MSKPLTMIERWAIDEELAQRYPPEVGGGDPVVQPSGPAAVRETPALVAAGPESVSPDDLAGITPLWSQAVQDDLLPVVAEVYQDAAGTVHAQLIDAADLPAIPPVTSLASEAYLAGATNTFEEVGSDLWETARGELLDGFQQGESIPELRDRLRTSAGLTGRTATLVARTQVLDASNAGSYDTARVSGLDLLKGWEATPDARTRDTHSAAGAFYQGDGMVPLNGKFTVGGYQCDRPHDPSLPPSERYRCRCTLIYAMAPAVPAPPKDRSAEIEAWHAQRLAQVTAQHEQRLAEAATRHARKLADLDAADAAETLVQAAQTRHAARLAKLAASHEARRVALAEERARRLGEQGARAEPLPSAPPPSVTTVTREEAERLVADLPDGPAIYYHGTRSTTDALDRRLASLSPDDPDGEIYLTDSPEFSLPYLEGDAGTVHAIRISDSARIASEDELWEAAEVALPGGVEGFFGYRPYAFDLAEHPQVRAELGRRGFDGAGFRDIAPNNVVEHDSIVVWTRAAVVGRVDRREVPQIGPDKVPSPAAPPTATPAAGTTPPPVPVRPRPSLAAATSTDEINAVFIAEWQRAVQGLPQRRRPTIRPPMVRFGGDLDIAREHAEGLLRSVERFPAVRLKIGRDPVGSEYASTEGTFITFVETWAVDRPAYLANLAQSAARRWHPPSISSPAGVATHEFAHALVYTVAPKLASPAKFRALVARIEATVRAYAAERGLPMDEVIKAEVSEWGALGTGRAGSAAEELAAEAFAQVLLEGDAAPVLARRVFAVLVDEYDRTVGVGRTGPSPGRVLPSAPKPEPTLATVHLRAGASMESSTWRAERIEGLPGPQAGVLSAITSYVRRPGFVNTRLRTPEPNPDPKAWRTWLHEGSLDELMGRVPFDEVAEQAARKRADKLIAALDRVMDRSHTPAEMTVYRGADISDIRLPSPGKAAGFTWTDAGYVSTSSQRSVAAGSFGSGTGRVTLDIRLPRDTPALRIEGLGEDEVLLGRGLTFRVIEDTRNVSGSGHVVVEVVPSAIEPAAVVEPGLARGVAEALQALTTGRTLAEVRTLLEALPEAKDALTIARRATSPTGLTRSLTALATRRGLTLPSAKELKAIQTAERAALVAERKAARAAAAEAVRVARAEKARVAEAKREAARLAKEEKARQAEAARLAKEAGASKAEIRLIRLSEQTPTDTRQLGGGASADVRLLTYPDGTQVVEKIYGKRVSLDVARTVDAEVLGVHVLEAVGLRAPAVVASGQRGRILMEYVDGKVGGGPDISWTDVYAVRRSDDGRLLGIADFLMGNTDRNEGNWLLFADGHIGGIDHGDAFRNVAKTRTRPEFFTEYLLSRSGSLAVKVDVAPEDLAIIRRRLEALEPRFVEAKRLTWFRQMMRRLAELEKRASGTKRIIT